MGDTSECTNSSHNLSVAYPGFRRRGRLLPRWGANVLFGQIFPENERNWTQMGAHLWRPLILNASVHILIRIHGTVDRGWGPLTLN